MEELLQLIIITAVLSITINLILKKYDFPPVIGYIVAGAIITYTFSLRDTSLHILHDISEFGIAFLMFTIGLEFSIPNFKRLKKEVFLFGTLQVIFSTIFFMFLAMYLFSLPLKTSIVIGLALALSSTAIVLKILNENGDIRKEYGKIVLGILLFQDLAVIPILLMLTFFTSTGIPIETMLLNTFISAALVLIILFLSGKYIVTPFLSVVFNTNSQELFIGTVLLIAITTSYIAYHFGFSFSLGAFIGGMLLSETPFKHQVEADLTPFRDLLLGVFFVTVGMQISFNFLTSHFMEILTIMSAVMVLKAFIIFVILYRFTMTSNALKSAITLSQIGEFSFVVLELARIGGITTKDINQTLVIAVVFSMVLTPFIIKNIQLIIETIMRSKDNIMEPFNSSEITGHIVVLGYGSLGQQICKNLKERGLFYVAIDNKHKLVELSHKNSDPFILGNANQAHILHNANIQNAMAVLITVEDDKDTSYLVDSVFHLSPKVNIVVSSRDNESKLIFDKRIRSFVHEHEEVASRIMLNALTCDIIQNEY
jgi:CPA2 family monovalent cation:H+ antiporter-2